MIGSYPSFFNFQDVKKALTAKFGKQTSNLLLTRCCILAITDSKFFEQVMFENNWQVSHLLNLSLKNEQLKEFR